MDEPPPARAPVSGVVICFNEEDGIARCLESLRFCDEIVVVDSFSTDRTVEIVRRYTDRVIQRPFEGFFEQRRFAVAQAKSEWILLLDADEALDETARRAVEGALAEADGGGAAGFELRRRTFFLGRWHEHGEWARDRVLRLFRRDRSRHAGRDPHDRIEVDGPVPRLEGHILHWNYRDLSEHVQTVDRFSASAARAMREEGQRFRMRDLLLRPFLRFLKGYLWLGGFRDGLPGLLVAISTSYYVCMKYAKLWELERLERRG